MRVEKLFDPELMTENEKCALLSNCKAGKHSLEIIYRGHYYSMSTQEIVRWCMICGSVVIDVDFDGRTNPGQIMQMRSPQIVKNG